MADEAVRPVGGERVVRRWGEDGYAGEWVRAVDAGDTGRARWIEQDDDDAPARRRTEREPGAGHADA